MYPEFNLFENGVLISNTCWIFVLAHNRLFEDFGEYPQAEWIN
jgi:hypothetical protein